jgi:hypothetical protein
MPRCAAAFAVVAALVVSLACGGGDDDPDEFPNPTLPSGFLTATASAQEPIDDKPTLSPTPEPGDVRVANESFSVETPDGAVLKGHAYTPNGPKRQALIIVAPVEQSIWAESAQAFASEGIAVFTFDLPGHGETGGEDADARALATDVRLLARFVISREYPLVYMAGFGETGGALVTDEATFQDLQPVVGTITYGYAGDSAGDTLSLDPQAVWAGQDVFEDPTLTQQVVEFVLDGN